MSDKTIQTADDFEGKYTYDEAVKSDHQISESMTALETFGDDHDKVRYLLDHGGYEDIDDAISKCDDVSYYPGTTMLQLAEQFVEEGLFGDIPDRLQNYIDMDAIARDLAMDYDEVDGDIFRAD